MRWLEHRFPPPLVAALVAAAMWLVSRTFDGIAGGMNIRVTAAAAIAVVGFVVAWAGIVGFRRAETTIDPRNPQEATVLVVGGVYRLTRNPMYLGVVVVLLAWAVFLTSPIAFLGPLLFAGYITRFQIIPEERELARRFGSDYTTYCQRVRRWL